MSCNFPLCYVFLTWAKFGVVEVEFDLSEYVLIYLLVFEALLERDIDLNDKEWQVELENPLEGVATLKI